MTDKVKPHTLVRVPKAVIDRINGLSWAELLLRADNGCDGMAVVEEVDPLMLGWSEEPPRHRFKTDSAHTEAVEQWRSSRQCSFYREGERYDSWAAGRALLFFQNW